MAKKKPNINNNNSRGLKGAALVAYKKQLTLTNEQKEVIMGTLMGDASMSLRNGKPVYGIKFEQGEKHAPYIFHLYELFKDFVGTPPVFRFIDSAHQRRAIWFRTYRHDAFEPFWLLFYRVQSGGKTARKVVTQSIADALGPRAKGHSLLVYG